MPTMNSFEEALENFINTINANQDLSSELKAALFNIDPMIKFGDGNTFLTLALERGFFKIARTLAENFIARGCYEAISAEGKDYNNALHYLCAEPTDPDALWMLDLFLKREGEQKSNYFDAIAVNVVNKNNKTPLYIACENEHPEAVSLLLKNNALIDSINVNPLSLFDLLIQSAPSDAMNKIIKILAESGAFLYCALPAALLSQLEILSQNTNENEVPSVVLLEGSTVDGQPVRTNYPNLISLNAAEELSKQLSSLLLMRVPIWLQSMQNLLLHNPNLKNERTFLELWLVIKRTENSDEVFEEIIKCHKDQWFAVEKVAMTNFLSADMQILQKMAKNVQRNRLLFAEKKIVIEQLAQTINKAIRRYEKASSNGTLIVMGVMSLLTLGLLAPVIGVFKDKINVLFGKQSALFIVGIVLALASVIFVLTRIGLTYTSAFKAFGEYKILFKTLHEMLKEENLDINLIHAAKGVAESLDKFSSASGFGVIDQFETNFAKFLVCYERALYIGGTTVEIPIVQTESQQEIEIAAPVMNSSDATNRHSMWSQPPRRASKMLEAVIVDSAELDSDEEVRPLLPAIASPSYS